MERIDHTNYEAWLLDRLEGTLSLDQERLLDAFLATHPELTPVQGALPTISSDEHLPLDTSALKRQLPPESSVTADTLDDHLIARMEGDLRPDQLEALQQFLLEHPEHQRTERTIAISHIAQERVVLSQKELLRRELPPAAPFTKELLDDFLVARLEGDLGHAQETGLAAYLGAHPDAMRQWKLMQATITLPASVVFADKDALKKGAKVIPLFPTSVLRLAAAASIVLLLGAGLWYIAGDDGTIKTAPHASVKLLPSESISAATLQAPFDTVVEGSADPVVNERDRSARTTNNTPKLTASEQEHTAALREKPIPEIDPRTSFPRGDERPKPLDVLVPEIPMSEEPMAAVVVDAATAISMGELLAATLRERVLDQPKQAPHTIDRDDAVAMADRGLKAVAGDRAGIAVGRQNDGSVSGFDLRLGRRLRITSGH